MKYILFAMFAMMMASETLSVDLSLAPGLSAKNAFVYIIVVVLAIQVAVLRDRRFDAPAVLMQFGMLVFYGTMSWLFMSFVFKPMYYSLIDSGISLKTGLWDHMLFLLVFLYGVKTSADARWLLSGMLWIVVFANLVAFLDVINLPDLGLIYEREDGRVSGPMGESNQYGAYMCFYVPLIVAMFLAERGAMLRLLAFGSVVISLMLLLSTASRGAFVGLAGSICICVVLLRRYLSGPMIARALGAGIVLGALVGVLMLSLGYGDLLYDRVIGQSTNVNASSGRLEVWGKAIGVMFSNPWSLIIGFGWEAYETSRAFFISTHNTYLNIFYDMGAIGIVLFLGIFVAIWRYVREQLSRTNDSDRVIYLGYLFGITAYLIAVFFVDIHKPWFFIWSTVGIILRLAVNDSRATATEPEPRAAADDRRAVLQAG